MRPCAFGQWQARESGGLGRLVRGGQGREVIARQIFFEGRVQGVGFRYATQRVACGFDVTGWVRNLPDGRVEVQVCGELEEVAAFIEGILESELKGNIRGHTVHVIPVFAAKGFTISR
jgi:acylphosphatase